MAVSTQLRSLTRAGVPIYSHPSVGAGTAQGKQNNNFVLCGNLSPKRKSLESVHIPFHNVSKRKQRGQDLQPVEFPLLRNNPQKWGKIFNPKCGRKEFSVQWKIPENIPMLNSIYYMLKTALRDLLVLTC